MYRRSLPKYYLAQYPTIRDQAAWMNWGLFLPKNLGHAARSSAIRKLAVLPLGATSVTWLAWGGMFWAACLAVGKHSQLTVLQLVNRLLWKFDKHPPLLPSWYKGSEPDRQEVRPSRTYESVLKFAWSLHRPFISGYTIHLGRRVVSS